MSTVVLETIEEEDVEIDPGNVVRLRPGDEPDTTIIELDDADNVVVIGTELEVAAELGLNPLEYIDAEDDDESIEDFVEEESDDDD